MSLYVDAQGLEVARSVRAVGAPESGMDGALCADCAAFTDDRELVDLHCQGRTATLPIGGWDVGWGESWMAFSKPTPSH